MGIIRNAWKVIGTKRGEAPPALATEEKKKNQPPDRQTYVTMSKEEEGREGEKGKG